MNATRIFEGLERRDTKGPDALIAARLGFLEWAVGLTVEATAQTARAALADPTLQYATSPAARAFVAYLQQATRPTCHPRRRKRLH